MKWVFVYIAILLINQPVKANEPDVEDVYDNASLKTGNASISALRLFYPMNQTLLKPRDSQSGKLRLVDPEVQPIRPMAQEPRNEVVHLSAKTSQRLSTPGTQIRYNGFLQSEHGRTYFFNGRPMSDWPGMRLLEARLDGALLTIVIGKGKPLIFRIGHSTEGNP